MKIVAKNTIVASQLYGVANVEFTVEYTESRLHTRAAVQPLWVKIVWNPNALLSR